MSDAIGDILNKKQPAEPAEFALVRQYVHDCIGVTPRLTLQSSTIIISVPSSAAASSLQLQIHQLKKKLPPNLKLQIRIG